MGVVSNLKEVKSAKYESYFAMQVESSSIFPQIATFLLSETIVCLIFVTVLEMSKFSYPFGMAATDLANQAFQL